METLDIYTFDEDQEIPMPEPTKNDCWIQEFDGTFVKMRKTKKGILVVVEDQEGDCFDIELERLLDYAKLDLGKIAKLPRETPKQRKARAELVLEYENEYCDSDECDDYDYAQGKRDGYSACLNDLFGTGNSK